ncbi:MAG: 4'-phosphopantetheinyl transferase superfamily protein [Cyanobacteria bacterium J06648_16]
MLWQSPPPMLQLDRQHLHLWRIDLSGGADRDYWPCLSRDERERAERFRFDRDRTRFVQSRGSLRYLLGRYLDKAPVDITFAYGPYGKPHCPQAEHLSFNLSHSDDQALCAVTHSRLVGVDVEQYRDLTYFDSLSRRCLAESELATLAQLPDHQRQPLFLQYWTCKEAYLKAIGCGLTRSLTSVHVQLHPPRLLAGVDSGDWRLHLTDLEGYAAAVVVDGDVLITGYLWT